MKKIAYIFLLYLFASTNVYATLVEDIEVGELYSSLVGLPNYLFESEVDDSKVGTFDERFDQVYYHRDFIENRLATLVSRLSDETDDPFLNVDDYQVSLLLAMMSDIDFRSIFVEKYSIVDKESMEVVRPEILTSSGFEVLNRNFQEQELLFDPVQSGSFASGFYNGLFTTMGFGSRFYNGGTNRKAVRGIYDMFLCTKNEAYKDPGLSMYYVAPDIDRMPGDKPEVFLERCSSCHATFDSQRGYAAMLDYLNGETVELDSVASKYNRNAKGYGGYITLDDSWENPLVTPYYQEMFGWRTATVGNGVSSFASMIVNSEKFSECMVSKVAKGICPHEIDSASEEIKAEIDLVARDFESKNYIFKELVKSVFRSPVLCSQ